VRFRNGTVILAGSLAATIVLAGCSSSGGSTPNPGGAPAGASGFNAAVNGTYNPSNAKGGTLKFVTDSDPDSLDGARFYLASMFNFSRFYLRTLVTEAAAPGKGGLKLVNDLASSQDISADGLTYTYRLKSGLKFEDGTAITSKDIKYGIERVFAQDAIPGGPTYLISSLDEGQKYPGPYKDSDPNKMGLKSVTTPDDNTIVFKLSAPDSTFAYKLAMGGAAPVPMAKDTGANYTNHPISSGPYKVKTFEPGKQLVLDRNPYWDASTDQVRKALPDQIVMTVITDDSEKDAALLDGTANVDFQQVGVQPDTQAKVLTTPDLKAHSDNPTTGFIRYISIVSTVPPFDNLDCRKAVQYATDKVALQTARGGPFAGGDIAYDMIPTVLTGHNSSLSSMYTGPSGKPDLQKAKAALQSCGQPNGFKTTIATQATSKGKAVAEALQQALAKVGIEAGIDATAPSPYYSGTVGTPSNVHKKGYGLIVAGWGADYPADAGYLQVLVDSRLIQQSGGNNNTAELKDPSIDTLIDQANKENDLNKSAAIWKQIDQKTMESADYLPFVYDKALNYRNPKTTNVYVTDFVGQYDFISLGVQNG
jgi:peptide/nickel transport system substrate-binding protein